MEIHRPSHQASTRRSDGLTRSGEFSTVRTMALTKSTITVRFIDILVCAALALSLAGCESPQSQMQIVDYGDPGGARQLSLEFDDSVYRIAPDGNLTLVLRSSADREAGRGAEQVVYVKTVWKSIPGETFAGETQINGIVTYAVLGRGVDSTYEGAGAVYFWTDPWTGVASGRLSRAILLPRRQLAPGEPLFKQVELGGEFHARQDARLALQTVNDVNRYFGPRLPTTD